MFCKLLILSYLVNTDKFKLHRLPPQTVKSVVHCMLPHMCNMCEHKSDCSDSYIT